MTTSLEELLLAVCSDLTLPVHKRAVMVKIAELLRVDSLSELFSAFGLYLDRKVMSFKNAKL